MDIGAFRIGARSGASWPARRMLLVAVLVGPFVLAPLATRWFVPRMARAMALRLAAVASPFASLPPPPSSELAEPDASKPPEPDPAPRLSVLAGSRPSGSPSRPKKRDVLYFGRDLVARAIPQAMRPSGSMVAATREHPAGIVIQRAGVLAPRLSVGDILIEAEGAPLTSFETLVSVVARAYEARARTISGKLWRRGEVYGVVVEPPW